MPLVPLDPKTCNWFALKNTAGDVVDFLLIYDDPVSQTSEVARTWMRADHWLNQLHLEPLPDSDAMAKLGDPDNVASLEGQIMRRLRRTQP